MRTVALAGLFHGRTPAPTSPLNRSQFAGLELRSASTSCGQRQKLSMRMGMRRFTRLTNAFSEKVENFAVAVSLHSMHYNFARPHKTLTKDNRGRKTTRAMAAGITNRVWTHRDIAVLPINQTDPLPGFEPGEAPGGGAKRLGE
jgi:hypothetical protein